MCEGELGYWGAGVLGKMTSDLFKNCFSFESGEEPADLWSFIAVEEHAVERYEEFFGGNRAFCFDRMDCFMNFGTYPFRIL